MGLTKKKKEQIVNAVYQAIEEVAENFGVEVDDVVDVFAEHVGLDEEPAKEKKVEKKAKKKDKAAKKDKKEKAEPPALEPGQKVKVKVDGKWKKGEVKRVLKTRVRVKTKDGIVSAAFEDVKPLK